MSNSPFPHFGVNIQETAPLRFKFKVAAPLCPRFPSRDISKAGTGYTAASISRLNSSITLAPGATTNLQHSPTRPTAVMPAAEQCETQTRLQAGRRSAFQLHQQSRNGRGGVFGECRRLLRSRKNRAMTPSPTKTAKIGMASL